MAEADHHVRVEQVNWLSSFPVLRMFGAFRMAVHPVKLLLALGLVALLYGGGMGLEALWGVSYERGELLVYQSAGPAEYEAHRGWVEHRREAAPGEMDEQGVFSTFLEGQRHAFGALMRSAVSLEPGLGAALEGDGRPGEGAVGALAAMLVVIPGWLIGYHPWFALVYGVFALVVTVLLGGAIARLAALHACRDERDGPLGVLRFSLERFVWFLLAPLLPVALVALVGLLMAVGGLIFFNLPLLDVVGGLIFGLFLLGGFVAALLLIGLVAGGGLLFPALAVEGTDAFDAISRAYNYVFGRPWRWLGYAAVAAVYGALAYVFVTLVVFVTLWFTQAATDLWVWREAEEGVSRFEAMLGRPGFGELLGPSGWEGLGALGVVAGALVRLWALLLVGLLPAFGVSFYFSVWTWIYLLLRWAADETEFEEIYLLEQEPEAAAAAGAGDVEGAGSGAEGEAEDAGEGGGSQTDEPGAGDEGR